MPYIDHEIILDAKKMDLLTYLENYDPHELVHVSGDVYCTKTHDSLRISNGKWCWYSRDIGGRSALDYLIKVKGYSFLDAVEHIMGRAATAPPVSLPAQKEKEKQLALPPAYKNADTADQKMRCILGTPFEPFHRLLPKVQHLLGIGAERPALAGQRHAAAAVKQRLSQFLFKLKYALAHGGLGDNKPLRTAGEILRFRQSKKGFKLFRVHGHPSDSYME